MHAALFGIRTSLAAFALGATALQLCSALPAAMPIVVAGSTLAVALGVAVAHGSRWPAWAHAVPLLVAMLAGTTGFGYAAARAHLRLADELPVQWEGRDIVVRGIVDHLPQSGERGTRFAFAVDDIVTSGAVVPSRLSLAWYAGGPGEDEPAAEAPGVHAGERWQLTLRLKRPHGYVNPAGFDLEAWLLERGFRAAGYVVAPQTAV